MQKRIWLLWFQGWDQAPAIVKTCLRSWQFHNPNWEIITLDSATIYNHIDDATMDILKRLPSNEMAAHSDVIRVSLLKLHGGIWADATTFCTQPLDTWLTPKMTQGFWAFAKPTQTRKLASWFIASEHDNVILASWVEIIREYWNFADETSFTYYWLHLLFNEVIETDPELETLWESIDKLSAVPPHFFVRNGSYHKQFSAMPSLNSINAIIGCKSPILKLSYKFNSLTISTANTNIGLIYWLFEPLSSDREIDDRLSFLRDLSKKQDVLVTLKSVIK